MESHASEESIASAAPQIQTRPLNQNLNTTSNEELAESSDAELMHDPNMEAEKVIVSPKSSMISSRLAEPETADIMSHRIMEFWINHEHEVAFAIERAKLQTKCNEWAGQLRLSERRQTSSIQESGDRDSQAQMNVTSQNRKSLIKLPTKNERNIAENRLK